MAANDTAVTTAVPDENRGPMLLATIYPLFGITLFVYAFRIWCRLTPKFALTIPDYIITIAMVSIRCEACQLVSDNINSSCLRSQRSSRSAS